MIAVSIVRCGERHVMFYERGTGIYLKRGCCQYRSNPCSLFQAGHVKYINTYVSSCLCKGSGGRPFRAPSECRFECAVIIQSAKCAASLCGSRGKDYVPNHPTWRDVCPMLCRRAYLYSAHSDVANASANVPLHLLSTQPQLLCLPSARPCFAVASS